MAELSVVIIATDNEQRAMLQVLVDGTSVARTAQTCSSFPVATVLRSTMSPAEALLLYCEATSARPRAPFSVAPLKSV